MEIQVMQNTEEKKRKYSWYLWKNTRLCLKHSPSCIPDYCREWLEKGVTWAVTKYVMLER